MKTKKLNNTAVLTIILSSVALVFLLLSIIAGKLNVDRCKKSINEIGEVTYSSETEEKIDLAQEYYDKLDRNIGLEKRIKNKEILDEAKFNYVRLALKKAIVLNKRKIADGVTDEEISLQVNESKIKLEKYYEESEFETITGYSEFAILVEKYGTKENNSENTSTNNNNTKKPDND